MLRNFVMTNLDVGIRGETLVGGWKEKIAIVRLKFPCDFSITTNSCSCDGYDFADLRASTGYLFVGRYIAAQQKETAGKLRFLRITFDFIPRFFRIPGQGFLDLTSVFIVLMR